MGGALSAGWFVFTVSAIVEPLMCILKKFCTVITQFSSFCSMLFTAIDVDHLSNYFFF